MSCSEAFLLVPKCTKNLTKLTEIKGVTIVKFNGAGVKNNKGYLFLLRKMKSVGSRKTQL